MDAVSHGFSSALPKIHCHALSESSYNPVPSEAHQPKPASSRRFQVKPFSRSSASEENARETQQKAKKQAHSVKDLSKKNDDYDGSSTPDRYLDGMDRLDIASLLQQEDTGLSEGQLIHAHLINHGLEQHTFLANVLMSMYRRVGSLEDSTLVFNKMLHPSVVSWNAMITLLSENGLTDEAFRLYLEMQHQGVEPNQVTLICALSTCTNLSDGKVIHAYIRHHIDEPPVKLLNALINMYGKCGAAEDAREVFDNMQMRNVVSWNTIIASYSGTGNGREPIGKEPIDLFWQMQQQGFQPDEVTLITVICACANSVAIGDGISIHAYIIENGFESNVVVGNALINMYGKCRALEDAYIVFARLPQHTVVSWNAFITACSEQGQANEAFLAYQQMLQQGVGPNEITFLSMIGACALPEALAVGKTIHKEILNTNLKSKVFIGNALISMYGKCGALKDAHLVFDNMSQQNIISWSALIAAYSENGQGKEALQLFQKMKQANVEPNEVTFLNLLSACCHAGMVKEGTYFLVSMVDEYSITPTLKHYNCMVDLLGRVGQLEKAEDMINQMPLHPDSQIWMTLLGACRIHKDATRAHRAAKHLFDLIPQNMPAYVQLSNIYATDGRWDDVDKVTEAMAQSV